jgi:cyclophilin family peptidyl-prolyl cis-trans isomerase
MKNDDTLKAIFSVICIFGLVFIFIFLSKSKAQRTAQNVASGDPGITEVAVSDVSTETTETTQPADVAGLQTSSTSPQVSQSGQDRGKIDPTVKHLVTLKTTKGDIVIETNSDQTPNTVTNFITLVKKGFYNNTIFHRVITGFMIQGGDPKGDGTGGPGYKFDDEPFTGEYTRGTVAMANSGPNTNGSQFFIMHADNPLPKSYIIFGHVVQGMDVVDAIATDKVKLGSSGEMSTPVNPVKITSATLSL